MFASLSSDFKSAVTKIETRIYHLESNIEKGLIEKVSDHVLKKVRGEIDSVKSDFGKKLTDMENKVDGLSKSYAEAAISSHTEAQDRNVIIRNLSEDSREVSDSKVLKNKVIALIRDGLKLKDVFVENVVRKKGYGGKEGVVIATIQNIDQKKELLKAKRKLKEITKYADVFIENNMSFSERRNEANLRTLLKVVNSDKHDFTISRGRIVKKRASDKENSSQSAVNRGELNQRSVSNGENNQGEVNRNT